VTTIRVSTEADIDGVAQVSVLGWQAGYAGIVPADYLAALDPAARAESMRTWWSRSTSLVAEDRGEITGFVTYGPDREEPSSGELYAIYVRPDHWGHGTGRKLLTAARDNLRAAGFPNMRLWVLDANIAGRRFYERMGLTPDGTTQTWTPRGSTVELPELRYATPL
jgi:GNAT superfamily N-acetyltransferase